MATLHSISGIDHLDPKPSGYNRKDSRYCSLGTHYYAGFESVSFSSCVSSLRMLPLCTSILLFASKHGNFVTHSIMRASRL